MKKFLFTLILLVFCNFAYGADIQTEMSEQLIKNEKDYAGINLNSQINPNGSAKKQNIQNNNSWFNINVNRYTYKFYDNTKTEESKQ